MHKLKVMIMKTDNQNPEYKKPYLIEYNNLNEITGGVESIIEIEGTPPPN